MNKFYAGLGSRETPPHVLHLMSEIGAELARRGFGLRAGADDGPEVAFESGAIAGGGAVDLILPWQGFNQRTEGAVISNQVTYSRASAIAAEHQPAWTALKPTVKKLMVGHVMKTLGADLESPVKLLLCWAPNPRFDIQGAMRDVSGTTGMAVRVAHHFSIPCLHLDMPKHLQRLDRLCGTDFASRGGMVRKSA